LSSCNLLLMFYSPLGALLILAIFTVGASNL
jgi:hypothetical protein